MPKYVITRKLVNPNYLSRKFVRDVSVDNYGKYSHDDEVQTQTSPPHQYISFHKETRHIHLYTTHCVS